MSDQRVSEERAAAKPEDPYFIEVDSNGCSHCGAGRTWCVVGPDGMASSTSYEDEDEASKLAERLNEAYWHGVGAAAERCGAVE